MSLTEEMAQMAETYIVGQTIVGFSIEDLPTEYLREINQARNLVIHLESGKSTDFFGEVHGGDLDYLSHTGRVVQDNQVLARVDAREGLDAFDGDFPSIRAPKDCADNAVQGLNPFIGSRITSVKFNTFATHIDLENGGCIVYDHGYPATVVRAYILVMDEFQCVFCHDVKYSS